ncbi:MAG: hypothetical protein BYD32DRAFT_168655 [Podila humilis]|nr:MAG: hypothetical protein BYD32DRAFT_168655 [Podila humilis]
MLPSHGGVLVLFVIGTVFLDKPVCMHDSSRKAQLITKQTSPRQHIPNDGICRKVAPHRNTTLFVRFTEVVAVTGSNRTLGLIIGIPTAFRYAT